MKSQWILPTIIAAVSITSACRRETPPAATAPTSPSAMEQAEQHLKAAGHEIKEAATQAAAEAKPVLHEAKEEAREALHTAAEKIANATSQPATTQPATQP